MNTEATYNLMFQPFPKMARLSRECIITEKLDGTNAQILIVPRAEFDRHWDEFLSDGPDTRPSSPIASAMVGDMVLIAGSRTRWIRPKNPGEKSDPDNYGFAAWVKANAEELVKLGPGRHFGEWFGSGINRAYGLTGRRFSLFNVARWQPAFPEDGFNGAATVGVRSTEGETLVGCCYSVPLIWRGNYDSFDARDFVEMLRSHGSFAVPGFKNPEGIVLYHVAANTFFKKTLEKDESPKSLPDLTNPAQLSAGVPAAKEAFAQKVQQS